MKIPLIFILMTSVMSSVIAQSPTLLGQWRTPDKAVIMFYSCDNALCAKQVSAEKDDDKAFNGKDIAKNFVQSKDQLTNWIGTIIDPSNNKTYKGVFSLSADGKTLSLRVKWGLLSFNEKWSKVDK
jgi:uncharacterized protein (DUF2147 family)